MGLGRAGHMTFVPHAVRIGADAASVDVWLLHGILGSGSNLRSLAVTLTRQRPELRLWLVDLRNHGRSQGAPPPHTIAGCTADLDALARHLGHTPQVVIGHSFGGKVALAWGARARPGLRQVWMLDASPAPGHLSAAPSSEDDVEALIAALRSIALPLPQRHDAVTALIARGFPRHIGQWMTTNLRSTTAGYQWVFSLDAIEAMLASHAATDLWSVLESPPPGVRLHLVRAERSRRWTEPTLRRLLAIEHGATRLHILADAGHWLHVDQPAALVSLLNQWL